MRILMTLILSFLALIAHGADGIPSSTKGLFDIRVDAAFEDDLGNILLELAPLSIRQLGLNIHPLLKTIMQGRFFWLPQQTGSQQNIYQLSGKFDRSKQEVVIYDPKLTEPMTFKPDDESTFVNASVLKLEVAGKIRYFSHISAARIQYIQGALYAGKVFEVVPLPSKEAPHSEWHTPFESIAPAASSSVCNEALKIAGEKSL
jgi:hypothetical protein